MTSFWGPFCIPEPLEIQNLSRIIKNLSQSIKKNSPQTLPRRSLAALGDILMIFLINISKSVDNFGRNPQNITEFMQHPHKIRRSPGKNCESQPQTSKHSELPNRMNSFLLCGGLASASSIIVLSSTQSHFVRRDRTS